MSSVYDLYFGNGSLTESVKTLRANIDFAGIDSDIRSVVLTSAKKGEGKSTIASCLAIAEAESGRKTLIIDNDFRAPQLARRFGIRNPHSLVELLNLPTGTDMTQYAVSTEIPNLYVLDVGSRRISNPVEILSSNKYKRLLRNCFESFDFIIIDAPPLGYFIDAAVIATYVDGVAIVVGAGRSTAAEEKEVLSQLEKANAHVIGVVLNGVKHNKSNYYYYYYDKSGRKKKKRRSSYYDDDRSYESENETDSSSVKQRPEKSDVSEKPKSKSRINREENVQDNKVPSEEKPVQSEQPENRRELEEDILKYARRRAVDSENATPTRMSKLYPEDSDRRKL